MRFVSNFWRLTATAVVAGWTLLAAPQADAAENLRLGRTSAFLPAPANIVRLGSVAVVSQSLTIGTFSPAYGTKTLGVSPLFAPRAGNVGSGNGILRTIDAGGYASSVALIAPGGAQVGVFGAYEQRPSIMALVPASSWNFAASVCYAGFYLRGGLNEAARVGPLMGLQGMQAGFGYDDGALDVRFTYLSSQGTGTGSAEREPDSKQWTIGGIYQISPSIRLNADAFYGLGNDHSASPAVLPAAATSPPGTGARVGVQLRF